MHNVSMILDPDDDNLLGHDFFNADVLNDSELFLDPVCIAASQHETCKAVRSRCRHFLETLLEAIQARSDKACVRIMEHVGERPEFRLGYCKKGGSGRGIGRGQRRSILENLKRSKAVESGIVEDLLDVANLVGGIGQDKVSDLIANVACSDFASYTEGVLRRYHSPPTMSIVCRSWSIERVDWVESRHEVVNGDRLRNSPVILVPREALSRKRADPSFAAYLLKEACPLGDLFSVFGREPPEFLYKDSVGEKVDALGKLAEASGESLNVALAMSDRFRADYKRFKQALVQRTIDEMRSNGGA